MESSVLSSLFESIGSLLEGIYNFHNEKTNNNQEKLETQLKKLEVTYQDFLSETNKISSALDGDQSDKALQQIRGASSMEKSFDSLDRRIVKLLLENKSRSLAKLDQGMNALRAGLKIQLPQQLLKLKQAVELKNIANTKELLENFGTSIRAICDGVTKLARDELGIK